MKVAIEKTIRRDDGSRVKVKTYLSEVGYGVLGYEQEVTICEKGKRTWKRTYSQDDYIFRRKSLEDRKAHIIDCDRLYISDEERLVAKIELWESIKPQ